MTAVASVGRVKYPIVLDDDGIVRVDGIDIESERVLQSLTGVESRIVEAVDAIAAAVRTAAEFGPVTDDVFATIVATCSGGARTRQNRYAAGKPVPTDNAVLAAVAADPERLVRETAARTAGIPTVWRSRFRNDHDWHVRRSVCWNPDVTETDLRALLADEERRVRESVVGAAASRRNLERFGWEFAAEVVRIAAGDPAWQVRRIACFHGMQSGLVTHDQAERLATDRRADVRGTVASYMPAEYRDIALRMSDTETISDVLGCLANSPAVAGDLIRFAQSPIRSHRIIAASARTLDADRLRVLSTDADPFVAKTATDTMRRLHLI